MTSNHMQAAMFKTSVLAGLTGAGLALLFAPRSGEETRQKLRQTASRVNQKMGKITHRTKDAAMATTEKVQEKLDEAQAKLAGDRKDREVTDEMQDNITDEETRV